MVVGLVLTGAEALFALVVISVTAKDLRLRGVCFLSENQNMCGYLIAVGVISLLVTIILACFIYIPNDSGRFDSGGPMRTAAISINVGLLLWWIIALIVICSSLADLSGIDEFGAPLSSINRGRRAIIVFIVFTILAVAVDLIRLVINKVRDSDGGRKQPTQTAEL